MTTRDLFAVVANHV